MVSKKLDNLTRREWESKNISSIKTNNSPLSLNYLIRFINERCSLLETLNPSNSNNNKSKSFLVAENTRENNKHICKFCSGNHFITTCSKFLNLKPEARYKEIKFKNLWTNCLKGGHTNKFCLATNCKTCSKRHHTLLHYNSTNTNSNTQITHSINASEITENQIINSNNHILPANNATWSYATSFNQVLISTAKILVQDNFGKFHLCRALLDSGSTSHLVTQEFFNRLNLNKTETNISISGIN